MHDHFPYQDLTDQILMSKTPGRFRDVLLPRGSSTPDWLPAPTDTGAWQDSVDLWPRSDDLCSAHSPHDLPPTRAAVPGGAVPVSPARWPGHSGGRSCPPWPSASPGRSTDVSPRPRHRGRGQAGVYGGLMQRAPWWTLLSSGCAPVLLIGGWATAGLLQGPGYDPVTQTISLLAAEGAPGRWVLTATLFALGTCHLVTAWGLRAAAFAGRLALSGGGMSVIALALIPAPRSGGSLSHGFVAAVAFALMTVWPMLAAHRGDTTPWALRPALSIAASVLMVVVAAWFLLELRYQGAAGAAERVLTSVQSVWPFVVAIACRRRSEAW